MEDARDATSKEEIVARLQELQLSKNEAKVYLALVTLGEAKASDVARESGVAREKTYRILKSLVDKGFAKMIQGNPRRWRAEDPLKLFYKRIEESKNRIQRQELAIQELHKRYTEASLKREKKEISLWEVGNEDRKELLREIISNSKRELILLVSPHHIDLFSGGEMKDVIKKVSKKDVKIQLVSWMIEGGLFQHAKLDYYTDLSITDSDPITKTYVVSDQREGIVLDEDRALHFTNQRVAETIETLIKNFRTYSSPLKHYIDLYDATNKIPLEAPLTPLRKLATLNRMLETMTETALESYSDGDKLVYDSTTKVLKQIFTDYDRLTLMEKLKLYKALLESLLPNITLDITPDTYGGMVHIQLTIREDGEARKGLDRTIKRLSNYPHPYLVCIDHELRMNGYRTALRLVTRDNVEGVIKVSRYYRRG